MRSTYCSFLQSLYIRFRINQFSNSTNLTTNTL
nr:MAG TPA: hypothetical protein [Caudoviricetes sp.]DAQ55991.1 MAG TPA: hypothetical protein [Caudoviricetes sp.]